MIWKTRDGRELELSEMSEQHLRNTIRMLERQLENRSYHYDHAAFCAFDGPCYDCEAISDTENKAKAFVRGMKAELQKRKVERFSEEQYAKGCDAEDLWEMSKESLAATWDNESDEGKYDE